MVHFVGPYAYRSSFGATSEQEEADRSVAQLAEVIQYENPERIAAVILETIVGTNGVLVPPADYRPRVRELCDAHGILLSLDEVMVGFGRTGAWFAADHWQVAPDLLAFAKGINSGYVPLCGVVMTDAIAETFSERAYQGGLTYSGHPLACAAAVGAIRAMEEDEVIEHAAHIGAVRFNFFFDEWQRRLGFSLLKLETELIQSSPRLLKFIHGIRNMCSHHLKILLKDL